MVDVPHKYGNLKRAAAIVRVPETVLLDEDFFRIVIADHDKVEEAVSAILEEIALTSGAVIDRQFARLEALLDEVTLVADWADRLDVVLQGLVADWRERPMAVRSAARGEDGAGASAAGYYESVLGVCGEAAMEAALKTVWRSYFRLAALMERLSAGMLTDGRRMCCMVQPMVEAKAAGVAFSSDPVTGEGAVLEFVGGLGDKLVSGDITGARLSPGEAPGPDAGAMTAQAAARVFQAVEALRDHFGFEVDIEWVWDGAELTVVQVRPVTAGAGGGEAPVAETVARVLPLYGGTDADFAEMGPVPEYVRYFRSKRLPLHRLSTEVGLYTAPAYVLWVTPDGLDASPVAACFEELARFGNVVIDASDKLRQMIVAGAEVRKVLAMAMGEGRRVHTIVLRAFIRGDHGFISQGPDAAGLIDLEYSRDGLLALNRGTAHVGSARISADGSGAPDWLSSAQARKIVSLSHLARERFGEVQLEWVHHGNGLTLLDYSPLSSIHCALPGGDPSVVGTGFAHAPVLRVARSDALADISEGPSISINEVPEAQMLGRYVQTLMARIRALPEPPILVCDKPYALLAALIPHVSGFVFSSASRLSHLSILIREAGKPALAVPDLYENLVEGERFMLDLTKERAQGAARREPGEGRVSP